MVLPQAPLSTEPLTLSALTRGGMRAAPATVSLLMLNIGVFAVMLVFGAGLWHAPSTVQLAWGANFGPATQDGAWWRLFTAMFLHFGLLHLAINMWALWDAGRLVERLLGPLRYVLLYLSSGLCGNLLSLVVQGNEAISGGASGAIFGVYGALLITLLRVRQQFDKRDFRWLFGAALAFTAGSLLLGLSVRGIDNAAHFGGLATGVLLGLALRPPNPLDGRATHSRERLLAMGALAAGVAALVTHIPPPRYRYGEEQAAREAIRTFIAGEQARSARWREILQQSEGQSFDALAGRVDEDIADDYADSFEALSALKLDPGAPSAAALERLRRYAQQRGEASHALAEALRRRNDEEVRQALDALREAATPPTQAASTPPRSRPH